MRHIIRLAFLLTIPLWSACYPAATEDTDIGVLVLAHGASPEWNRAVLEAVNNIRGNFKKEIVFGMGDASAIQRGIENLERLEVKSIVIIPLFVSSASEMYRNIEYTLGLRNEPDVLFWLLMTKDSRMGDNHSGHNIDIAAQVKFSVPYAAAPAINYHRLIASILEERLRKTGAVGKDTGIFLVAHGPISEDDNKAWLRDLNLYADFLARKFRKARFFVHTFRDDAPLFIRDRAIEKIQSALRQNIASGKKVIVLPYLLAPGGRELEIQKIFGDCLCVIHSEPLLPHKNISLWIEKQVRSSLKRLRNQ